MDILGISAHYHDSAVALVRDGNIIAAAQEERFSRKKHDPRFPVNALKYCLAEASTDLKNIDYIVFYDKPFLKFERLLETYIADAPRGLPSFIHAIPVWIKEKLYLKDRMIKEFRNISDLKKRDLYPKILFSEHHLSHAASAFFPSPFQEAAVITVDGVGEWTTTSIAHGHDNCIDIVEELKFPHSLGLLYSALTYYTGFKVNSGEYKVMGLAPYGEPRYVQTIKEHLIDIKEDGSFKLNMDYFNFTTGLTMTNRNFDKLFGGKPRKSESVLTQKEMDLARSVQDVTEEVIIKMAKHAQKVTKSKNLCLAGGVALNCVANGKISRENIFQNIWIQPAAGDAGGALGAALAAYYIEFKNSRTVKSKDSMQGAYLGKSYSNSEIESVLKKYNAKYEFISADETLFERLATYLAEGKVIGWHMGRMEFGPRALGARSIIGDARNSEMQKKMNLKIKYRESFRPFAPSVLSDHVSEYFEMNTDSPYMLLVASVTKDKQIEMTSEQKTLFGIDKLNISRSQIPAVTHIDYSARVQTVHQDTNPKYYALINTFYKKTGCPVIVNTSFNVRGEPIVCSPEDSYRCFMRTEKDVLVIDNFLLLKEDQPKYVEDDSWKEEFQLD